MKNFKRKRYVYATLCAVMAATILPLPALAAGSGGDERSRVAIDKAEYTRPAVLEAGGIPFWYQGIQIRIDKLREDPDFMCTDDEMQELFQQVKEDGYTVVNSQIRWTDVQPNHTSVASESSYIYGGEHANKAYEGSGGIKVQYDESNESNQALGYVKFHILDMSAEEIDGAKIRLYNRNSLGSPRKLKIYAIKDDSWNKDSITWNNAPSHTGYEVDGDAQLVAESEDWDMVKSKEYYDFNISEVIKNSEWAKDGTVSFIIQETSGDRNVPDTPIVLGDFDDKNIDQSVDGRPQLIYSDAEEYNYDYLDQAIDFAKNAGLKFELLWFGTDTCSITSDMRVPVHVQMNYQKTLDDDTAHTPLLKKFGPTAVTGDYSYIMCKNDLALRELEADTVKSVFNHIAQRGDDVVVGCQVSNEPGVGRLHGTKKTPRCMCDACTSKIETLGVSDGEFREITMWEYNNNIAKAVKTSDYPVWTRVNLDEHADVEGVAYNEKMRASADGTCVDFIGIDHYRKTPAQLAMEGQPGSQWSQGKNLPMVMELGQKDDRENGIYLEQDALATLSGGAFVNNYDACSNDGSKIYELDKKTRKFVPIDNVIPGLFKANRMLQKIGCDLATKLPGAAGGDQLMYYNAISSAAPGQTYHQDEVMDNKGVSFSTVNNGVGIAVNKGANELALLSTREDDTFTLENINAEGIASAELGYYDTENNWVKEETFSDLKEEGKVSVKVPAYSCLRITTIDGGWKPVEKKTEVNVEIENSSVAKEGIGTETWNDGASAGGWLKVLAKQEGDYVTVTADVSKGGVYQVDTCYRSSKDRAAVQLEVDGENLGAPFDMYAAKAAFTTWSAGEVALAPGKHEFKYTVAGKNETSSGYIMGLDYLFLKRTGTDRSILEKLYDSYKDATQDNYTQVTWQVLQTQLAKTGELLKNEDAVQDDIDTQLSFLKDAINGLLIGTDMDKAELYVQLEELMKAAKVEVEKADVYTKESLAVLTNALKEAKNAVVDKDDPAFTAENVATVLQKLQKAMENLKKIGAADMAALNAMIGNARAEVAKTDTYTADSIESLNQVIQEAQTVLDDSNASQDSVDEQVTRLQDAIKALVPTEKEKSNKQALNAMISMVEQLKPEDFSSGTWAALEEKLEAARGVMEKEDAAQEEVDTAYTELVNAFGSLEAGVNTVVAIVMVQNAEKVLEEAEKYRPEGIQKLQDALKLVQADLNDPNISAEELNRHTMALLDALINLRDMADGAGLQNLLDLANGLLEEREKFTTATAEALAEAVKSAKEVLADQDRTQEQIEAACTGINKAISGLKVRGDKGIMVPFMEKARELLGEKEKYTEPSLEGLQEALEQAQGIYDNIDALLEEINQTISALAGELAEVRILGDVNNDGAIDTADTTVLLRANAELETLADENAYAADVNRDGVIDTKDAVLIQQYAAELRGGF